MTFPEPGFHPTHFTVDTIGEPGRRVFVLQVGNTTDTLSIKLEKAQVRALCADLTEIIENSGRPGHLPDDLDLRAPVELEWAGGNILTAYVEDEDRVMIVVDEVAFDDEDDAVHRQLSVFVTREQAAAVAIRGTSVVESGRPPCPLCGYPIDPDGHACPRTNGNRPPGL